MGDPSGVGPAVIAKALKKIEHQAEFVVIGDKWVFNRHSADSCQLSAVRFIDLNNVSRKNFRFGKVRAEYGRASIEYLDKALELIRDKEIECLVTAPISKVAINLAGFKSLGHTEYLAKKTHTKDFVMMLLNKKLKLALVTRHIPLNSVSGTLNTRLIYKNALITHKSLKELFAIKNPRIVVCGINPHASDNGLIGEEESTIIAPAIKRLKRKRINIVGPLASDIAILKASRKEFDCVVTIYHDQALIALKASDASGGVNITLGLPFIRTSPLHGTAFDIAGNFRLADPRSLIEAISLAIKCTSNLKKD